MPAVRMPGGTVIGPASLYWVLAAAELVLPPEEEPLDAPPTALAAGPKLDPEPPPDEDPPGTSADGDPPPDDDDALSSPLAIGGIGLGALLELQPKRSEATTHPTRTLRMPGTQQSPCREQPTRSAGRVVPPRKRSGTRIMGHGHQLARHTGKRSATIPSSRMRHPDGGDS